MADLANADDTPLKHESDIEVPRGLSLPLHQSQDLGEVVQTTRFHRRGNAGDEPQGDDVVEILDNRGDLILVVGTQKKKFQVCSRTIARASAELEKHCRESTPHSEDYTHDSDAVATHRRVYLPKIDPHALHVVLIIIHGSPTQIFPKLTDLWLLRDVLIVTHHFDMTDCLAPVAAKWLKKTYDKDVLRHEAVAAQLWITYQLGHLGCVKQTITNMVMSARLNPSGELIGYGAADTQKYCKHDTLKALGILDQIQECRGNIMTHLVRMVETAVERLTRPPLQKRGGAAQPTENGDDVIDTGAVCRAKSSYIRCDCAMLGAMHRAIAAEGWNSVDLNCSPQWLYKKIQKMTRMAQAWAELPAAHAECDPFGGQLPDLMDICHAAVETIPFDESEFVKRGNAVGFEKIGQVHSGYRGR
ncbi:hypothetical protein B0H63DRAFT_504838 [Podospora didyma]|uniref:BTB domain-containing protein n=1 Tax=Podospora didyma TaxID=330526 RepID=A0AAE0P3R9_9PEZI|nr:hypothetical protein B0H63DRAFT_504838 [Podospora didyma]